MINFYCAPMVDIAAKVTLIILASYYIIYLVVYILESFSYMGVIYANGHLRREAWIPFRRRYLMGKIVGTAIDQDTRIFALWYTFTGICVVILPFNFTPICLAAMVINYITQTGFNTLAVYRTREKDQLLFTVLAAILGPFYGLLLPNVNFKLEIS